MLSLIRAVFDLNRLIAAGLLLISVVAVAQAEQRDWGKMRNRMIEAIKRDMQETSRFTGKDKLSSEVLEAVSRVERHLFIPEEYLDEAYDNHPLPIGKGQTISQPFIVALMTELLDVRKSAGEKIAGETVTGEKIKLLELGTGSGYQAAILAELADEVFTIEVVEELASQASRRLKNLGYTNVSVKFGDGTLGWPEAALFDGIMVTAAGVEIPDALIDQLKPGANMVMPVGGQYDVQYLMVITRQKDGSTVSRRTLPVRFVPITSPND